MSEGDALRLEIIKLSKRYGAVQALDGVNFELRAGEVVALLGENGAGKSTLVKALSGLVIPDSGEIVVDGRSRAFRSSQQSQAAGIAVVQQEYSSVPNLTVAENIFLGQASSPFVWRRGSLARAAEPLLERVGLSYLDPLTQLRFLTVAERQLIEIARILARDARIVIFDEPTASLSDAEIVRVLNVIRALASEGRGVIYVTHRLNEVFQIGDRVVVFRDGRSMEPVLVNDVDAEVLVTMILGKKLNNLFPLRTDVAGAELMVIEGLLTPGLEEPVSLRVRAGEIVGLTGQMGSGAGLVVQALAGRRPILAGAVRIGGEELSLRTRSDGIREGIGYCSADRQLDGMFPGLSVGRNLSSPWLSTVSRRGVLSRTLERELVESAARGIAIDSSRLTSPASVLSGGNQQKVALGRWASGESRVLLVEEPTRGVDIGARSEIYRRLRSMCDEGMAIVVASSDTSEILGFCDTIGSFYRGRLTAIKSYADWTGEELLAEVMSEHVSVAG